MVASACDDGGPESVIGEWRLVSIGGQPLPFTLAETEYDTATVIEASLEFEAGGVFEARGLVEQRSEFVGVDTIEAEANGEWDRMGRDVELTWDLFGELFLDTLFYDEGRLVNPTDLFGDYVYERSDE